MAPTLVLDPAIRDWVMIPIVIVTFLVSLFRTYLAKIFRSEQKESLLNVRIGQILQRSSRLRANGSSIPKESFEKRKQHFNHAENGILNQTDGIPQGPVNVFSNPDMMMGQMNRSLTGILPNMILMGVISFIFSGFVVVKLPFSLTQSFRSMLQRSVDLNNLDISYVSSMSWYLLNFLGLRGVFAIILGEAADFDDVQMMQQQMNMGMNMNAMTNPMQALTSEKDSIELVSHKNRAAEAEARLLKTISHKSKK